MKKLLILALCVGVSLFASSAFAQPVQKDQELFQQAQDLLTRYRDSINKKSNTESEYYLDQAIKVIDQAITINGENPDYYLLRGYLYACKHDDEQEINNLKKAIEVAPDYSNAYYRLAVATCPTDEDACMKLLEKAIELDENNERAHHLLGAIYNKRTLHHLDAYKKD